MEKDPFKEYLIQNNLENSDLTYSWYTAIGLQKVDGLETSDYLKEIAIKNINGNINLDSANELIHKYYIENNNHDLRVEEADKVAVNITRVLADRSFIFSPTQYLEIHKNLFYNVYVHAGKLREYNISKKEWVLDGDTVIYGGASLLKETLDYDFNVERVFDYSKLSRDEFVNHIARFISNLWQIHCFAEGNTRTTAVFLIKYLRKFGFDLSNDIFANNAWYFRNALVRANYNNVNKGVYETLEYLEKFLKNLLFNEHNILKNRFLHISWSSKVDIDDEKEDIKVQKVDIQKLKVDINQLRLTNKSKENIIKLFSSLSDNSYFSRSDIVNVLNVSPSGASKIIVNLLKLNVIIPVLHHGKGKYKFNK